MEAYHGTTEVAAREILRNGFKIQIKHDQVPNDLGDGVYFFIESGLVNRPEDLALNYAMMYKDGGRAVIKTEIKDGVFVNLDNDGWITVIDELRRQNTIQIERKVANYSSRHGFRKKEI